MDNISRGYQPTNTKNVDIHNPPQGGSGLPSIPPGLKKKEKNMKTVELIRLSTDHDQGTFGVLLIDKTCFCVTLEPPDQLNAKEISSIPTGQYTCTPYSSAKYPGVYQVLNVPGRSRILFHKGNVKKNTKGCIILGQYFDKLKGERAVLNSGVTFRKFRAIIGDGGDFHLTVKEVY